jgi:HK97 family phage portal protein
MGFLQTMLAPLLGAMRQTADVISDGAPFWWRPGSSWGSEPTQSGETIDEVSLLTSATCFACTKALAETVAGLPGQVFRDSGKRKEADSKSPAYELLTEQPNPEMDAFTFWELLTTRVVNAGNFFAEIQRNNRDEPIALWPIHPSRVTPRRSPSDGSLYWEIASDYTGSPEYSDPTWREDHLRYLSPHHFLNVVGFGSQNGIISPGMLPAAQEVGMEFATRRYGASFFKDGAIPAGVIEHPSFIDNEAKRNLFREDINRIHNAKRHQTGVLWQGAKYNQISIAPEQAQFLETRKFTSDQLCKFYGVPPAIIGDYEYSKFATADAMIRAFVMITLRNLVIRGEKAVNRQVLSVRNEQGKLERAYSKKLLYQIAIDGLLRGDPKTQAETHQVYRNTGILTTNEIREEIGFNPIEGEAGDYVIVQGGMARLEKIDEQGTRQSGKNAPVDDSQETDASLPKFGNEQRQQLVETLERLSHEDNPVAAVRGHSFDVTGAVVKIAEQAIGRINKITSTQVERWREQDPNVVATKLPDFWNKQKARLDEALEPLAALGAEVAATVISDRYYAMVTKLDNYSIFGEHPTLDIEEIIDATAR